jgi:DNA-binding PadR family transcriptional regulator
LAAVRTLDEPHGLGVKQHLEAVYGVEEIHHGRLYPNLDALADKGLIEKGTVDDRTNSYSVTARGERELGAHIDWLDGVSGDDA